MGGFSGGAVILRRREKIPLECIIRVLAFLPPPRWITLSLITVEHQGDSLPAPQRKDPESKFIGMSNKQDSRKALGQNQEATPLQGF